MYKLWVFFIVLDVGEANTDLNHELTQQRLQILENAVETMDGRFQQIESRFQQIDGSIQAINSGMLEMQVKLTEILYTVSF